MLLVAALLCDNCSLGVRVCAQVDTEAGRPRVNYRETITKRAEFDYLHKKQSGRRLHFQKLQRDLVGRDFCGVKLQCAYVTCYIQLRSCSAML